LREALTEAWHSQPVTATARPDATPGVAVVTDVGVRFDGRPVLTGVDLCVRTGEVVAVMGRNGAGKSTLLSLLAGQRRPDSGAVAVADQDPARLSGPALVAAVALVPQEPQDLLWAESVAAECRDADQDAAVAAGTTWALFRQLRPTVAADTHPNDLSEGTRLILVLAIMMVNQPRLLVLDEPTRGLDYGAKEQLAQLIRGRAARGEAVVVATHDVELVADVCTRMVMLADGEVVLDTDARSGAVSSPTFAPQVAKILAPQPLLTVAEVRAALPGGMPS
jgi:energy-coupling factor transport system ATP-binding protein